VEIDNKEETYLCLDYNNKTYNLNNNNNNNKDNNKVKIKEDSEVLILTH
jgi:hypothetical protein